MKIHSITLTRDELLDWINTIPSEKKEHVRQCFNEAEKDGGGLFLDGIEKIGNLLCFTVLIYSPLHAIKALSFQAPSTPEGRAELESAWYLISTKKGETFE